jgi:3-deoxy-manno-octulosonate cytidylyltransferase (CMP-KDO synthetase)
LELSEINFAVMIPARYRSSRFPGKPLIDICGIPMIIRVWQQAVKAVGVDRVFIVTDDERIANLVESFGGKHIMTSQACLTGTDRIAEANVKCDFDFIVNVQGDEPLINPEDIIYLVEEYLRGDGEIVNAMLLIDKEEEFLSLTVPKVVVDNENNLLYMSRAGIPLTKEGRFRFAYKQVCIYVFSKNHLLFFLNNKEKSKLESVEDIEILRFVEAGYKVKMVQVENETYAVDIPEDVERVERKINELKR